MSKVVVIGGGVIGCAEWSREVASTAGVNVDVRPQRGQLAALDPGEVVLRHSIFWATGYLVPKADGTVIAGSPKRNRASTIDQRSPGSRARASLACRLVPRRRKPAACVGRIATGDRRRASDRRGGTAPATWWSRRAITEKEFSSHL